MRHEVIEDLVAKHIPERAYAEQWDAAGLKDGVAPASSTSTCRSSEWAKPKKASTKPISASASRTAADKAAAERAERFGREIMPYVERSGRAADARPSVARAHRQPRPPAFRHRLPRLCPARPAAGIQVGSLRAVPGAAGNLRQAVTAPADARRTGPARRPRLPDPALPSWRAITSTARPARTSSAKAAFRAAEVTVAPENRDPQRPVHLGQGRPQRSLPLRLGQEVQALPRRLRAGLILVGRDQR